MITLHMKSSAVRRLATALRALATPRTRATVADKVMESGKMAGQTKVRLCVPTARKQSAQARIRHPGRRRQGSNRMAATRHEAWGAAREPDGGSRDARKILEIELLVARLAILDLQPHPLRCQLQFFYQRTPLEARRLGTR